MIQFQPSDKIVILTGAGMSAESGIRTFRDADGLWEEHAIEDVATPEGYARDPELVWNFYNARRKQLQTADPNPGHHALATLEKKLGSNLLLVTQNVDNLHERAGSKTIIHMHGELIEVRCPRCDHFWDETSELNNHPRCTTCDGPIRPHIVWFGEMPFEMERIQSTLARCSWFLAIGTSGQVYPAAQFIQMAKYSGAKTIVVNPDPNTDSSYVDHFICKPCGEALPNLIEEWAF